MSASNSLTVIPPGTNFTLSRKARDHHRAQRAKSLLASARKAIIEYNLIVRHLPQAELSKLRLFARLDLLHSEAPLGPVVATTGDESPFDFRAAPVPPKTGLRHDYTPPSRAELRLEARRNRVPPPQLWDRFPPANAAERAEMARELARYNARRPAGRPLGFADFMKAEIRKAPARASDPKWRAEKLAEWQAITSTDLSDILSTLFTASTGKP